MELLSCGVSKALLSAVATGVQNSSAYALPNIATQVTWQTSFGSNPASLTAQLQVSNDNSAWSTIDTSTVTTGESKTVTTGALYVRARLNAISGGSGITIQLVPKALAVIISAGTVTDGSLALFDGTSGNRLKELLFPGDATEVLKGDGSFGAISSGGTPGGSNTQIQFNDSNAFGGDTGLTYNKTTKLVTVKNENLASVYDVLPSSLGLASNLLRVGMGESTPAIVTIESSNNLADGPFLNFVCSDGTMAVPASSELNARLGYIDFYGYSEFTENPIVNWRQAGDISVVVESNDTDTGVIGTKISMSPYTALGSPTEYIFSGSIGAVFPSTLKTAGYKSSDGSDGITQDVTTASLIGKTMVFKNGLLVGFA